MIVLPNSFERYLSALRISVSVSILKHGLKPQHLVNLRKILTAEALLFKNSRQSVDINKLCTNLLGAVSTIKENFNFKCEVMGNFIINKNILTLLLLSLAKEKIFLKVTSLNDFLLITFDGKTSNLSPLIKALNVFTLYEIKTNQTLIVIPTKKTQQKSIQIESEWEYLFNNFSVVNLIFDKI